MPQDRTLAILCTFNGYYDASAPSGPGYYGTMTYTLTGSTPEGAGAGVVTSDGTISVADWANPDPSTWSDVVDITFSLTGQCMLQDGSATPVIWSPNMNNDPDGQPAMLLTDSETGRPAPAQDVEASWVSGSGQSQILVDDKNEERNYYFRPAIVIPAAANYYISCDPPIVNKKN